MLRGMGWKVSAEGIGLSRKGYIILSQFIIKGLHSHFINLLIFLI